MASMKKIEETWEVGSANVFADLDMPEAAEKLAKAELAHIPHRSS